MKHVKTFESFVLNEGAGPDRGKPLGYEDKNLNYSGPGFPYTEFVSQNRFGHEITDWYYLWDGRPGVKHTTVVLDVLKNLNISKIVKGLK